MRFRSGFQAVGLAPMLISCLVGSAVHGQWSDDFDDYETDSTIAGQGGWDPWDLADGVDAGVSEDEAESEPNSLRLALNTDVVRLYSGIASGLWEYRALVFIPFDHSGETFFILLNQYAHNGPKNWSTQVVLANGEVRSSGGKRVRRQRQLALDHGRLDRAAR